MTVFNLSGIGPICCQDMLGTEDVVRYGDEKWGKNGVGVKHSRAQADARKMVEQEKQNQKSMMGERRVKKKES